MNIWNKIVQGAQKRFANFLPDVLYRRIKRETEQKLSTDFFIGRVASRHRSPSAVHPVAGPASQSSRQRLGNTKGGRISPAQPAPLRTATEKSVFTIDLI